MKFGALDDDGSRQRLSELVAISFFGIRGIGSFYYLAYAYNTAEFEAEASCSRSWASSSSPRSCSTASPQRQ